MSKVCHMLFQKCLWLGRRSQARKDTVFAFSRMTYDILYGLIDPLLPLNKASPIQPIS